MKPQKIYYCKIDKALTMFKYLGKQGNGKDMTVDFYQCQSCGDARGEGSLREDTNKVLKGGLEIDVEIEYE